MAVQDGLSSQPPFFGGVDAATRIANTNPDSSREQTSRPPRSGGNLPPWASHIRRKPALNQRQKVPPPTPLPNDPDGVPAELFIGGDHRQIQIDRLRNDQPVERIAVVLKHRKRADAVDLMNLSQEGCERPSLCRSLRAPSRWSRRCPAFRAVP